MVSGFGFPITTPERFSIRPPHLGIHHHLPLQPIDQGRHHQGIETSLVIGRAKHPGDQKTIKHGDLTSKKPKKTLGDGKNMAF
jgi:hypothetical protein